MAAANLSGNYEYEAPGSKGSRTVKKMTLNGNGTVHYREEGETSLETFVISGQGTWRIVDDHVEFRFPALNKKNTLKRKVLVPGLEVPHTTFDDGFDVDVDKLLNAPVKGLHKWKRVILLVCVCVCVCVCACTCGVLKGSADNIFFGVLVFKVVVYGGVDGGGRLCCSRRPCCFSTIF